MALSVAMGAKNAATTSELAGAASPSGRSIQRKSTATALLKLETGIPP